MGFDCWFGPVKTHDKTRQSRRGGKTHGIYIYICILYMYKGYRYDDIFIHYSTQLWIALQYRAVECFAMQYSPAQCRALHGVTWHHMASHGITLHHISRKNKRDVLCILLSY